MALCQFCKKNEAGGLCDFPTGTIKTTIDFKIHRTTCDKLMCIDCATVIANDTEFCPDCMNSYKNKFINWQKEIKENHKNNIGKVCKQWIKE